MHVAPARRVLTLRVLHVHDQPAGHDRGGAEVLLARLVAAQREAGDEPHVLAGEVVRTGVRRVLDLWDPVSRRLVQDRIASTGADVVHLHNVVRELSPSVIGAAGRVPVVMTVHDLRLFGGGEHHLPDPRAVADRLVLGPITRREVRRHVSAVLAVSAAVAESVRAARLPVTQVVPVPVPPPVVPPRPVEACWDVLLAATLARDKGAHVLLEAFARVAQRHPAARLVLAGTGPESAALQAAAQPLGSRVQLVGRLDPAGVSAAMGRARVVVAPSLPALRREGSSLTAVEAARHGRPVITSDDPALEEIAHALGGDVVPAGDVAALARRLDHWLGAPESAAAAGARAEVLAAERFDVNSVAASVRQVYAEVIAANS